MRLKDKTHRKFVDFFEKMSNMHQGQEFELAYSDIQRETGAASVTLKRAIQALEEDGIVKVNPGRNSRYARFQYLIEQKSELSNPNQDVQQNLEQLKQIQNEVKPLNQFTNDLNELFNVVDHLRRRIRTQEMTIALLQDRVAELEDKIRKH